MLVPESQFSVLSNRLIKWSAWECGYIYIYISAIRIFTTGFEHIWDISILPLVIIILTISDIALDGVQTRDL